MWTAKETKAIKKVGLDPDRAHRLEHSKEVLFNVHSADTCDGEYCTIHRRSDHGMRGFPQHWRGDRGLMERVNPFGGACPDPDSPWSADSYEWVHGCIINPYTNSHGMCQPWQINGVDATWITTKYAVTKDGNVWSFVKSMGPTYNNESTIDYSNPRQLVGRPNGKGYLRVQLDYKDYYVHRLVLNAWKGECPDKFEARHLDGNKINNSLDNLVWSSRSDNNMDKIAHKTMPLGEHHKNSRLKPDQVRRARILWDSGSFTLQDIIAQLELSVHKTTLHEAVTGKTWKHL